MGASATAAGDQARARLSLDSWPVVWTAAGLSLLVAWVHLAYWESHFEQWWAYGAFFVAVGAGQALFAPVLLKWPTSAVVTAGVAGNLAVVGMYVISRTVGVPVGPHAEVVEHVGAADLAATAVEIALVGLLLALLGPSARRRTANLLLAAGVGLWVLRLTGNLP